MNKTNFQVLLYTISTSDVYYATQELGTHCHYVVQQGIANL